MWPDTELELRQLFIRCKTHVCVGLFGARQFVKKRKVEPGSGSFEAQGLGGEISVVVQSVRRDSAPNAGILSGHKNRSRYAPIL